MADTSPDDARAQFFEQLGRVHAGMLRVKGSDLPAQPMSPYPDADAGIVWFLTNDDSDLMREVGAGAEGHFTVTGKDHDYWAAVMGRMTLSRDSAKIDELWNRVAAAFFEGGRDDPNLCLCRLDLERGQAWASTGSTLVFGAEILRANLREEHLAQVGGTYDLRF